MPARTHLRSDGGDDGFTLVEVMVSVAIIAVVMLGLGAVFVATAAGTDVQGSRQAAARIATDGLDRAHALSGPAVVRGRDRASVDAQWATRPAGVSGLLTGLTATYDATAGTGAGRSAALPTRPSSAVVDGVTYRQSFYVAGCNLDATQACRPTAATGTVPMYDVVVSVGWTDRSCPTGTCTYELSTLLAASTTDPLFNSNLTAVAPVVTMVNGLTQFGSDLGETITAANGPRVTVAGGNGGVSLTAGGLPAGVALDPNTGTFTGTLGALTAGTTVTVTATDRFGLFTSTTFTWTVNPPPTLTTAVLPLVASPLVPATITLPDTLKLTNGTGPYTWACTGLPATLSLDTRTGAITGLLAGVGVVPLTCTATDARGQRATATLTVTVVAPLTVANPASGSTAPLKVGVAPDAAIATATATGGTGPYTWSATALPTGLALSAAGVLTGTPKTPGTFRPVFTVKDAAGRIATSNVTWTVAR